MQRSGELDSNPHVMPPRHREADEDTTITAMPSGRPPVVLQVLPDIDGGGGVERGTIDIARALVRAGWGAIVASNGERQAKRIDSIGGRHVRLPLHSKNPVVMAANIGRLARLIEEAGIDLVHARSRAPAWSAYYAARRARRAFVTTVHGTYGGTSPLKRAYNKIMTRGTRVIAISEFIAAHVVENYGADPRRIDVIPRGVDLAQFDPNAVTVERIVRLARRWRLEDGAPVIMLPGRLTPWKGHAVLIEALALVARRDAIAVFVGGEDGTESYQAELAAKARQCGVEGRVHLVGRCDDMSAAYMLADVVVSASIRPEAFGRIAVEAQAMGIPVIATSIGATSETVLQGVSGWLVPPRDPAALARAIEIALAMSPEERRAQAAVAREHVASKFALEVMCERTLAVYGEVLTSARRA